MADYVYPGGLFTADGGSTPDGFAATVAGAIEQKLHDLVLGMTGKAPFDTGVDDADARARRALFVAIAQAVFEHLQQHAAALTVHPASADHHTHSVTVQVSEP